MKIIIGLLIFIVALQGRVYGQYFCSDFSYNGTVLLAFYDGFVTDTLPYLPKNLCSPDNTNYISGLELADNVLLDRNSTNETRPYQGGQFEINGTISGTNPAVGSGITFFPVDGMDMTEYSVAFWRRYQGETSVETQGWLFATFADNNATWIDGTFVQSGTHTQFASGISRGNTAGYNTGASEWKYVTYVKTPTSWKMYEDGVPVVEKTFEVGTPPTVYRMQIGGGFNPSFAPKIDFTAISIFKGALTRDNVWNMFDRVGRPYNTCDFVTRCGTGSCDDINDVCVCDADWTGPYCLQPTCNGTGSHDSNVCSKQGECLATDVCDCKTNYYGDNCDVWKCFGIFSNDTGYCNDNGECAGHDTCACTDGWTGPQCEVPICNGIANSSALVCNGRGYCNATQECVCSGDFTGDNCEWSHCPREALGWVSEIVNYHDASVGFEPSCEPYTENYFEATGTSASTMSFGSPLDSAKLPYHDTAYYLKQQAGNGLVLTPMGNASFDEYTLGFWMQYQTTDKELIKGFALGGFTAGNAFVDSLYLSDSTGNIQYTANSVPHGDSAVVVDTKWSYITFTKDSGNHVWYIDGKKVDEQSIVSTNSFDKLTLGGGFAPDWQPDMLFTGITIFDGALPASEIEYLYFRFGRPYEQCVNNCFGNGTCVNDICQCNPGFGGAMCQFPTCNSVDSTDPLVCEGHGVCNGTDSCKCDQWYGGQFCEIDLFTCNGTLNAVDGACNNNGNCTALDVCACEDMWVGKFCEVPVCYGQLGNVSTTCSGHGNCIGADSCFCASGYSGDECEYYDCNRNLFSTELQNYHDANSIDNFCLAANSSYATTALTNSGHIGVKVVLNEAEYPYFKYSYKTLQALGNGLVFDSDCECNFTSYTVSFFTKYRVVSDDGFLFGAFTAGGANFIDYILGNGGVTRYATNIAQDASATADVPATSLDWHFVTVVKTKTNFTIYIDGAPTKRLDISNYNEVTLATLVTVGGGYKPDRQPDMMFTGVSVWNGALSSADILTLYTDHWGRPIPTCVKDCNTGTCVEAGGQYTCQCTSSYDGPYCQYPVCNSYVSTDTVNVCNGVGTCIGPNNCTCPDGYTGEFCGTFTCDGLTDVAGACNGVHGTCTGPNTCTCTDTNIYGGLKCNVTACNGFLANDTANVCNGRGTCDAVNNCTCTNTAEYGGIDCELTVCFGESGTEACGAHGTCTGIDNCTCLDYGLYAGPQCVDPVCFNIISTNASSCGLGNCTGVNTCTCDNDHEGTACEIRKTTCYGVNYDDVNTCNGQGSCLGPDNCNCTNVEIHGGPNCNVSTCYDIRNSSSCNGIHGTCTGLDTCTCTDNAIFTGLSCETPVCNGLSDATSCNGLHGTCTGPNTCTCTDNALFTGLFCDEPYCFGIRANDSTTCSGNGVCRGTDDCNCASTHTGQQCDTPVATLKPTPEPTSAPTTSSANIINITLLFILSSLYILMN